MTNHVQSYTYICPHRLNYDHKCSVIHTPMSTPSPLKPPMHSHTYTYVHTVSIMATQVQSYTYICLHRFHYDHPCTVIHIDISTPPKFRPPTYSHTLTYIHTVSIMTTHAQSYTYICPHRLHYDQTCTVIHIHMSPSSPLWPPVHSHTNTYIHTVSIKTTCAQSYTYIYSHRLHYDNSCTVIHIHISTPCPL